jgi:hypothetical protein
MTLPTWAPPDERKPAPEPLPRVQAFVNTRDLDLGTDLLADADAAHDWLHRCGPLAPEATAGAEDLRAARDVRESPRGAWCDMASCGNLIKNRNLRARRGRQQQPAR